MLEMNLAECLSTSAFLIQATGGTLTCILIAALSVETLTGFLISILRGSQPKSIAAEDLAQWLFMGAFFSYLVAMLITLPVAVVCMI